ncbi:hypothetical protein JCM33374_g2474 [Metschnikowia sp. JCM 33374]|nr:hypothetical protein JCM33374_g2474 [Metschnikowia sp. JCM 33374]
MPVPVVIVGAGVIGLTTALKLKQEVSSVEITVVATFLPGDSDITYTSPYAGANWMSFASKDDVQQHKIDEPGYHEFDKLAEDPRSGVWRKKNALYYTQIAVDRVDGDASRLVPWYEAISNGRQLSRHELVPGTIYGREFDGFVISVPTYLPYLVQRCLELGIVFKRVPKITNIDHAKTLHASGKSARIVVNCAGLLASEMDGVADPRKNYAVRGQVIVVRNTISKIQVVSGFDTPNEELYVFPRKEGGAIIGGSFYKDNWDANEDPELTKRIIDRAVKWLPELVDPNAHNNPSHIDIVKVHVGLRPAREGGHRIEKDPTRKWLIHGYGAGGGGYQSSYGFANKLVRLVSESLVEAKL